MATSKIKRPNSFMYLPEITATDDLDNFKGDDYYPFAVLYCSGNPINAPVNLQNGFVVVLTWGTITKQIAFDFDKIYTRTYTGNPRQWYSWVKFTGTTLS